MEHNLPSVTMIAPNTTDADATACMISGLEKSKQFIENLPDVEAYFIFLNKEEKNEATWTKGVGKYFYKPGN